MTFGANTWATANVARAYASKSTNLTMGISLVVVGVAVAACFLALMGTENVGLCIGVAVGLVLLGGLLAVTGARNWWVTLEMVGGKTRKVYTAASQAEAQAVADAVNEAIAQQKT
jgi:hypothetical protein